jgi:hypothetical protein
MKLEQTFNNSKIDRHVSKPKLFSGFSPAFQLFLIGMAHMTGNLADELDAENIIHRFKWSEFDSDSSALYGKMIRDPQIPYFYVIGKMPNDNYYEAFAQSHEKEVDYSRYQELRTTLRSYYTKDIASILNRWLIDTNIPYASYDQLEREDMIKEGSFLSHYMNSLLFTTFSGICALTLQPSGSTADKQTQPFEKPFEPAVHSILRFIEYSRMRWHQGISINRQLDKLVEDVRMAEGTAVVDAMRKLMELRLKVAKYMQNPITYRWDATVGTAVAKYIQEQVIEELETATERKLSLIKEVLMDRLDILQSQAIIQEYEHNKPQNENDDAMSR